MRRVLAVLAAVVAAAAATWWAFGREPASRGGDLCAEVERRLREGDVPAARAAAERVRPALPEHLRLYLDSVLLMAQGPGADAEAAATAERAWSAGAEAQDDWRVVSLVHALRVNAGAPERAWEALDGYLGRHPDDDRALAEAARHWLELRRPPDGARAGEYLLRIERLPGPAVAPDDPTAVAPDLLARLRAELAELTGKPGSAMEAAEARVQAAPGDVAAWVQLGEVCRKAGNVPRAREAYRQAVKLDPTQLVWRKQLVMLLLIDDWGNEDVGPVTEDLLRLAPDDPEARLLRARGLVREDRYDDAIDAYRALLAEPGVPDRWRRDALRNFAMALYDWKQGGLEGPYLDDARNALAEYRRMGGEFDLRLRDIWAKLGLGPLAEDDGER